MILMNKIKLKYEMFGPTFISIIFIFGSVKNEKCFRREMWKKIMLGSYLYIKLLRTFYLRNTNYFMTSVANYDSWWRIKKATTISFVHSHYLVCRNILIILNIIRRSYLTRYLWEVAFYVFWNVVFRKKETMSKERNKCWNNNFLERICIRKFRWIKYDN